MNVHHNNVQVNHHPVELGDQKQLVPMNHEIMFVLVRLHQKIGDDRIIVAVGVREKKNV
jgi:hypothetical protein